MCMLTVPIIWGQYRLSVCGVTIIYDCRYKTFGCGCGQSRAERNHFEEEQILND